MYLYVRINTWDILTQKRKQQPSPGDYTSRDAAAPRRVGRDGQGEARRANTIPNGGPHVELGHLRLKTWFKSGFSIAETTWPTYLYIYLYAEIGVMIMIERMYRCLLVNTAHKYEHKKTAADTKAKV